MIHKQFTRRLCCAALTLLIALPALTGCSNTGNEPALIAENLMAGVPRGESAVDYDFKGQTELPQAYEKFTQAASSFAANLLKETGTEGKNTLLSPLSAYFSLAMVQNGAAGTTAQEMKKALGGGVVSADNINACSNYLIQRLTAFNGENGSLALANSLWAAQGLDVLRGFLQKNANFYSADVFRADFSAPSAAQDINSWVSYRTGGIINQLVDKTQESDAMYLLNTIALEDLWATGYTSGHVSPGTFRLQDGTERKDISFLDGTERYIHSDSAQGYIKNLKTLPCRFVAVLPNEGISLRDYIKALDEKELSTLFSSDSATGFANTRTPVFQFDFDISLKTPLQNLGIKSAFAQDADFTRISSKGELRLSDVVQKTYIELGPQGVKAGAATQAEISQGAQEAENTVVLDRPFLFMIVDNESNVPVFMGALYDPAG